MAGFSVGVVGATGLVGRTILQTLEEQRFPVRALIPMASARSAGTTVTFEGQELEVRALSEGCLEPCDVVFFSAGADVSRTWSPVAARHARLVIDNSSAFRMDPSIPLVVPEVNAACLDGYRGIVANPNCSTIQMVVALYPLHLEYGLDQVVVSTYQSVSGSGQKGVAALERELEAPGTSPESPYPHPIAFNALPHIDVLDDTGWSGEERKMINETRKIMNLPNLHVVPTTVRVPVRVAHSESVYAKFSRPVTVVGARAVLSAAPGIVVQDEPAQSEYPLALNAEGRDEVFVGRLRQDLDDASALALWIVSDNLRKGAATNAVQIAQHAFMRPDEMVRYA